MMKTFIITEEQEAKISLFKKEHKECFDKMPTATDGKYPLTYVFIPGGIATISHVKCNGCGKEINITDYNNW